MKNVYVSIKRLLYKYEYLFSTNSMIIKFNYVFPICEPHKNWTMHIECKIVLSPRTQIFLFVRNDVSDAHLRIEQWSCHEQKFKFFYRHILGALQCMNSPECNNGIITAFVWLRYQRFFLFSMAAGNDFSGLVFSLWCVRNHSYFLSLFVVSRALILILFVPLLGQFYILHLTYIYLF